MSVLGKLKAAVVLDVTGLALIALALGLVLLPLGIGAAGVGCLLLAWRYTP